jgi:hypothetical protein
VPAVPAMRVVPVLPAEITQPGRNETP